MKTALFTSTLAMLLLIGCSSGGRGEGAKSVESFSNVRNQLAAASAQVDKTLAAMDQMAAGADLSKTYANYVSEVSAMEKQAEAAEKRGDDMRENVKAYVSKWQAEMEEIDDPTITASMESRRAAVKANFSKVRESGEQAREAYAPFMSRLRSIEKAIKLDMTPAAVTGMKPAMDQAHADGTKLKTALATMQSELDRIKGGMSATPAAK